MKTLKTLMAILIVGTAIFAISCKKDENNSSSDNAYDYKGKSRNIAEVVMTKLAVGLRMSVIGTINSGDYFEIRFGDVSTLNLSGTYTFKDMNDPDFDKNKHFVAGLVDAANDQTGVLEYIEGGTITIKSISESSIDFTFDLLTEEGNRLKGQYKGKMAIGAVV